MPDIERQTAAVIASGDPEALALGHHAEAVRQGDDEAAREWLRVLDEIQAERERLCTGDGEC